jgi:PAS domain S-box-containing protein
LKNLGDTKSIEQLFEKDFTLDLLNSLNIAFVLFQLEDKEIIFRNKRFNDLMQSLSIVEFEKRFAAKIDQAILNKESFVQFKVKNDHYRFKINIQPVKNHDGVKLIEFNVLPIHSEELLSTYQKFMDNSPNSIFSKNRAGKFTFCNVAFAKFYNSIPSEMIGKTDLDFHYDVDKAKIFQKQDLKVMNTQAPLFIPVIEVTTQAGDHQYFQTLKVPVIDKEGHCNEVLGFSNIITERILAEKSLEKSESMFRNLYDKSPIGVLLEDNNDWIIANPAFCKMIGYSYEELRELKVSDIVHIEDQKMYAPKIKDLAAGRIDSINLEKRYIKKDGSIFNGNVHVGLMNKEKGKPKFIAFIEDVSLKKAAAIALQESSELLKTSEERFRNLFEQSPFPMVLRKVDAPYYSLTNQAFADLLECSIEETLTKKRDEFVFEEPKEKIKESVQKLINGKINKFNLEKRFKTKAGNVVDAVVTRFLVTYKGGVHIGGIIEDVTDLYKTMDALQESESKYRKLYDNAFDGLITIDLESQKFIQCNESACRLFGFKSEYLFCLSKFTDLVADQDDGESSRSYITRMYKQTLKKNTFSFFGKAKRKDNSTFYAQLNVVKSDAKNNIAFFMIKDVSVKIKAEIDQQFAEQQMVKIERQRLELDSRNRELASYTMYLQQKNRMLHDLNDYLEEIQAEADSHKIKSKLERVRRQITRGIDQQNDWKSFKIYFERIHPDFFYLLRQKINNLSQNELKHCAYIKMNLSQKEVADLLYVQPKTVEVARYRLKKKLKLTSSDNLINFIQAL